MSAMAALTDEEGMALLLSSSGEDIAAGEEDDAARCTTHDGITRL